MIPILYGRNETAFESEGMGRLSDCSRCESVEGVDDVFEIEFDYPVTGKLFDEIEVGRIVFATHDDTGIAQPFDIYRKSEPIDGVVTFNGHHISYRLNEVTVSPFVANSCAAALQGLKDNSVGANPFTFSTDKQVSAQYVVSKPSGLRGLLGGQENSILDVYGKGEYKFDKWSVQLLTNRGTAKSTSIRYGKNLIDYTNEYDAGDTYNAVYPYWFGSVSVGNAEPVETLVELPEQYISSGESVASGREVIVPMDLSQDFQEKPTVAQLRARATELLANSEAWAPSQTITVDFVALWQTEEYEEVAPLQSVNLCDTVSVVMPMYNTSYRAKVIRTEYDVLLDRYSKIELGSKPDTLASVITSGLGQTFTDIYQKIQQADATGKQASTVAGNTNQHFWFTGAGTDTGAHITEVTQDEFLADPTMGGANLLARSNGIAVRDGLTELATFTASGASIGQPGELRFFVTPRTIALENDLDEAIFSVMEDASGNIERNVIVATFTTSADIDTATRTISDSLIAAGDVTVEFECGSTTATLDSTQVTTTVAAGSVVTIALTQAGVDYCSDIMVNEATDPDDPSTQPQATLSADYWITHYDKASLNMTGKIAVYGEGGAISLINNAWGTGNKTDTFIGAINSNTGKRVYFGVGAGGENRGVYDKTAGNWMCYADNDNATHLWSPKRGAQLTLTDVARFNRNVYANATDIEVKNTNQNASRLRASTKHQSVLLGAWENGNIGIYDNKDARFLLKRNGTDVDINSGRLTVPDSGASSLSGGLNIAGSLAVRGDITIGGHASEVGHTGVKSLSSAVSVSSGTAKAILSVSLSAGTWVVVCRVRFPSNATGRRVANFSATSGDSSQVAASPAIDGAVTTLTFTEIISLTSSTTYYLNAFQNSGSSLSMPAGAFNQISYVRIA